MIKESWRIGDIKVTKLVETEGVHPQGGDRAALPDAYPDKILEMPWLVPQFATQEGHLRMSIHALLVQTPDMRLVVDTCTGNDKPRRTEMFNMLQTDFLGDLERFGWSRDSVDGVLCTHLHVDHVGWNTMLQEGAWIPTFPKAKYYMARDEFRHWASELEGVDLTAGLSRAAIAMMDTRAVFSDSVKPIFDADLAVLVETDAVIAPGVRLIPTTGHTPGHVSVVLESQGQTAIITGDFMHHPCQIGRPHWCSAFDYDRAQAEATRLAFFEQFADTPTLIIGTHFGGPTAGRLVREAGEFRFRA